MNDVAVSTDDDLVTMSPTYPSSQAMSITFCFRSQASRQAWLGRIVGNGLSGDMGKGGTRGDQVRGTMLGVELRRAGGARLSSSQRSSLRLLGCLHVLAWRTRTTRTRTRLAGVAKDDGRGSCTFAPATRFETPTSDQCQYRRVVGETRGPCQESRLA